MQPIKDPLAFRETGWNTLQPGIVCARNVNSRMAATMERQPGSITSGARRAGCTDKPENGGNTVTSARTWSDPGDADQSLSKG